MDKNDVAFWHKRRGRIYAKKGGWIPGEAVYNQGYDQLRDLAGKVSYMQVVFLNALGWLPEKRLADWLEATFVCMSWPDHRIWCNQIGSLAASLRTSSTTAIAAGLMANDSHMYGSGPLLQGALFTEEALKRKKTGMDIGQVIDSFCRRLGSKPVIVGFARPLATGDNRVPVLRALIDEFGYEIGEHLQLLNDIHEVMLKRYDESMNVNAIMNGFLLDQGLTPQQILDLYAALVQSGIHACWAETVEQPPESFFPLQCEDIDYQGKSFRQVPEQLS